jgi:hypothetical protein
MDEIELAALRAQARSPKPQERVMYVGSWLKSIQLRLQNSGFRSTPRRERRRHASFASSIQQLEDRSLLSANSVHVFVQHGTLFIEGTGGDDSILIQQGNAGSESFSITGQNGTQVNGLTTAVAFTGVDRALRINLGGGDDTIVFDGTAGGVTIVGDLFIATGAGDDNVQLNKAHVQGHARLLTRGGDDTIDLNQNTFDGRVRAATGGGRDHVLVDDTTFGGPVNVSTGAGADQIDIERRAASTGTTTFNGPVRLRAGSGNDRIQVGVAGNAGEQAIFNDKVVIRGGSGDDNLSFSANNTLNGGDPVIRSVHELEAPVITAGLAHDTAAGGTTNTDGITSDATIQGTLSSLPLVDSLTARFDNNADSTAVDILSSVNADGTFTLTPSQLQQINGSALSQGAHTLHLTALDNLGNIVATKNVTFTLDSTAPVAPTLNLSPASDSAPTGDNQTTNATVSLIGTTEAAATVKLQPTGTTATAGGSGNFTIDNVPLVTGANSFTVTATDAAGNTSSTTKVITRI